MNGKLNAALHGVESLKQTKLKLRVYAVDLPLAEYVSLLEKWVRMMERALRLGTKVALGESIVG